MSNGHNAGAAAGGGAIYGLGIFGALVYRNLSTILRRRAELFTESPAVSNWAG